MKLACVKSRVISSILASALILGLSACSEPDVQLPPSGLSDGDSTTRTSDEPSDPISNGTTQSVLGHTFYLSNRLSPVQVRVTTEYEDASGKPRFVAEIIRANPPNKVGGVVMGLHQIDLMNGASGSCVRKLCVGDTRQWSNPYDSRINGFVKILALSKYSNSGCDIVGESYGMSMGKMLVCHRFEDFNP